ncbi:hypothetical protein M3Y97_00329700 [Aphelenchoides bicaudatus]|nr:hypothetical protein M3Y97_00329700 [Aphelenchoides bicaudatus]
MISVITKDAGIEIQPLTKNNFNTSIKWVSNTMDFIKNGTFDLVAAATQKTDELEKTFDFTEPFFFQSYDKKVAWQVLRLQLHQSHNAMKQPNAGARLSLSVFAFFQCYLMLSLFSSLILISSISLHHTETDNPIDLLINGVRSGRYRFVVTSNKNWFFDLINNSRNTLLFQQTDNYNYFLAHKYCELVSLEQDMPVKSVHLMLRKNHPLLDRLNRAIKANHLILEKIFRKYQKLVWKFDKCPRQKIFKPLRKF